MLPEEPRPQVVARALLNTFVAANKKSAVQRKKNYEFMKKFLLGLLAVSAMLLPMSQSAQAHWVYYHHYYPYHHFYARHYWHYGYWYGGFWHPGYWGWDPAPVVVIAPY